MRTKDGRRRIRWPANEFSWAMKPDGSSGLLFFLGVEPNLRWRAFSQTIAGLAKEMGVKTVVHMGALLDAVPHTRTVRVTGSSTDPALREAFENREIRLLQLPGAHRHQLRGAGSLRQRGHGLRLHVGPHLPLPPSRAQLPGQPDYGQISLPAC